MEGLTIASFEGIISDIEVVTQWFFSLFNEFFVTIVTNDLILWPVIFAIAAGAIGLVIKVVRKFGVKGRR